MSIKIVTDARMSITATNQPQLTLLPETTNRLNEEEKLIRPMPSDVSPV